MKIYSISYLNMGKLTIAMWFIQKSGFESGKRHLWHEDAPPPTQKTWTSSIAITKGRGPSMRLHCYQYRHRSRGWNHSTWQPVTSQRWTNFFVDFSTAIFLTPFFSKKKAGEWIRLFSPKNDKTYIYIIYIYIKWKIMKDHLGGVFFVCLNHPYLGKIPILTSNFSIGLKPPTSIDLL